MLGAGNPFCDLLDHIIANIVKDTEANAPLAVRVVPTGKITEPITLNPEYKAQSLPRPSGSGGTTLVIRMKSN